MLDLSFFIGIAIGLILGWNFLAQPEWVKTALTKVKNWFFGLFISE